MIQFQSNKKGFTLIEAIVVAVIILVLASVAIPIFSGFVNDARQNTVDNLAETAAAAANTFVRKRGEANLTHPDNLDLHYDQTKYTISLMGNRTVQVSEIGGSGGNKTSIANY